MGMREIEGTLVTRLKAELENAALHHLQALRDAARPARYQAEAVTHEHLSVSLKKQSDYWSERCLGELSQVERSMLDKLADHERCLKKMISQVQDRCHALE